MRRLIVLVLFVTWLALPLVARAQSSDIDAVVLVDTSASMIDDLDRLCADLPDAIEPLRADGLNVRVTVIGIRDRYRCADATVRSLLAGSTVASDEDWGVALADLASGYAWQPDAARLIVPVSDAGPAAGDPVEDPGPDRDVTTRAIRAAVANKVILSPVLARPDLGASPDDRTRLEALAREMAAKTGGSVFESGSPYALANAVARSILSATRTESALTPIAATIPTPGQVSLDAPVLLTNALLAGLSSVTLLLSATLYGEIFGKAQRPSLPDNRVTQAASSLVQRVQAAFTVAATPAAWGFASAGVRRVATAVVLAIFFALTALVASFLDPGFQPNAPGSVVTFITLFAAVVIVNLSAAYVGGGQARAYHVTPGVQVRPGALLLVAACVVVSRSIGFLPGYLVGLPAGLALMTAEDNRARDAAIGRASIFAALASGAAAWLLAWLVESLSTGLAGGSASGAASLMQTVVGGLQSMLLAMFLVALQFALFEMLPIGGLAGRLWFAQNRLTWGVCFGAIAFAALHTLFNPGRAGFDALRNASLLPLGAFVAAYSGIALAAWLLTNEARLRDPQHLSRRSALTAGALFVAWAGGLACVGLAEVMGGAQGTVVLIVLGAVVVIGAGTWVWNRLRGKKGAPPETRSSSN